MMRAAVALLLVACSTSSPPGDAAPIDASEAGDDAPADTGIFTCAQPENSGAPTVSLVQKTAVPPAAMGGPIEPGLYQLTAYNQYGAMDAGMTCCARVAMRITPIQILKASFFTSAGLSHSAVTYTINGATLVTQPACNTGAAAATLPYTALGDTVMIYSGSGVVDEEVYQRTGP